MYSKADYLKNFAQVDSDTLLDRLSHHELTDDAREAMLETLASRGVPPPLPVVRAADIGDDVVLAHANAIRQGDCPRCRQRRSPVELRTEHWVWSAIFITRYGRRTSLACRPCARAGNLKALLTSTLFGWWGFPFGLLITPYKIVINVVELLRKDRPEPSDALRNLVRSRLAAASRQRL